MKIQEHISAKFYIYLYRTFEAEVSDFDSALDSDLGEYGGDDGDRLGDGGGD